MPVGSDVHRRNDKQKAAQAGLLSEMIELITFIKSLLSSGCMYRAAVQTRRLPVRIAPSSNVCNWLQRHFKKITQLISRCQRAYPENVFGYGEKTCYRHTTSIMIGSSRTHAEFPGGLGGQDRLRMTRVF